MGKRDLVMHAIGEASMCWCERPAGIFDSERAIDVGERLLVDLEQLSNISSKEQAEQRIQCLLAEAAALADEYKIEFKFLGCTMHYQADGDIADQGLLLSDYEWHSSNCYGPRDHWLHDIWLKREREQLK